MDKQQVEKRKALAKTAKREQVLWVNRKEMSVGVTEVIQFPIDSAGSSPTS